MIRGSLALVLAAGACGAPPAHAPDDVDATPAPDASADPCAAIAMTAATADVVAIRDALVAELWAAGHTGASGDAGEDGVYIRQIRASLPAVDDPGAAALAWLTGLGAVSLDAAELAVTNAPADWSTADSAPLVIMRPRAGAIDTRFFRPAAQLHLLREADGWRVSSLVIWPSVALATAAEAATLAACTPAAPPADAPVRATTFEGLTFRGCGQTGTYTYQPDARDAVAWGAPITWERVGDRWRILVPATLTIDPANWWSAIAEADCWCDDVAGFELAVDAVTGEVVRYRPGINCVVC